MKKKLALLFGYLFIGIGLITAQTQKVTGTVISDDDKQPVVGASIVVKGTNLGTITDIDGHFTLLNVPNSAKILQISYIGMKTESVSVQPTVRVILKSDTQLMDEVVVVGYGSAKKLGSVVGSVTTVNNSKIANRPVANAGDALQGQVAGLHVHALQKSPRRTSRPLFFLTFRDPSSRHPAHLPLSPPAIHSPPSQRLMARNRKYYLHPPPSQKRQKSKCI